MLVDKELARQLGLSSGSMLQTTRGAFRVIGTFSNPSGEPLVLMDIAHAQKLFTLNGFVDRVDLILTDEPGFRARWEKGFLIQSGRQRSATFSAMLGAFRLNLEALSLLALFVGVFLIYNTAMFAVLNRRRDTGILRSLGAKRYEIIAAFLTEILILGFHRGRAWRCHRLLPDPLSDRPDRYQHHRPLLFPAARTFSLVKLDSIRRHRPWVRGKHAGRGASLAGDSAHRPCKSTLRPGGQPAKWT